MECLDLIIMGAGPAGLTAGIYAGYYNLKALIFEENIPGGLAAEIPVLENYPGCGEGISGRDLINRMVEQCEGGGIEIRQLEKVIKLNLKDKEKIIETDKSKYTTNTVIIASGRHSKKLDVPGEEEFYGKGVSRCALCDGGFFKNSRVIVVGGEYQAAEVSIYLSGLASSVTMVCSGSCVDAEEFLVKKLTDQKVKVLTNREVKEIKGDTLVKSVVLSDKKTGDTEEIEAEGVFLQLQELPTSGIAKEARIKVDEKGFIVVDEKGRTSIDNVYAVGDVTDHPVKQVITAVDQASVAISDIIRKNE